MRFFTQKRKERPPVKGGFSAFPSGARPLPFTINHNLAANLSDQVADGLRQAILSGYYRSGEALPKFADIAKALGVSMRIPREAVAQLAAENLVSPRPRVGSIVLGAKEMLWKGQILAIVSDRGEGSFHASIMLGEMRRQFVAAGYLFTSAAITRLPHGGCDMSYLDLVLRQHFDFIFPLHCPASVYRRLDGLGIRWARLEGLASDSPNASFLGDLTPFLEQCSARRIRKVLLASYGSLDLYRDLKARFIAAGLRVESHRAYAIDSPIYLEQLERESMRYFLRRFRRPRETWPDLILWADDFLAFGGLTALQELGVRIPDDVYAVTLANKGFGPVYPRTLTRFEFDSVETGRLAALNVLSRLKGADPGPIRNIVTYQVGESFPALAEKQQCTFCT